MNEQKILNAIANLADEMQKNFAEMGGRFAAIEKRLGVQEKEAERRRAESALHAEEIDKLKEIVYQLAEEKPARVLPQGTAVHKKDAYPLFAEQGLSARTAMCALRNAGAIRPEKKGPDGKTRNTIKVRIDGKLERVILVMNTGKETT